MMRAVLVAAIACVAGCTYDFDSYLPTGQGLSDATAADAPVDTAPCVLDGGDACYATARSCGGACRATRTTCEAACSNPGCRKNCRDAETACKSKCVNDCTACTTGEGCATTARCATEVG